MKSLITKRSQRIITIIIALVLLLNCSTFTSAKQVEPAKGQWESKIEEDLREAMEAASDDEYIPVWLWRKNIDQAELNSLILEKTGYDPEIYDDISQFKEHILPEIEEEVRKNHERDASPIRQAANLAIGTNDPDRIEESLVKEATRDRINDYTHQRRLILREEYSRRNTEFLDNALTKCDDRDLNYCIPYIPSIIVEATKSEIEVLAQDESVESISLFVDGRCEAEMCDVLSQVGIYCDGGTGYGQPGYSSALTGSGIKIGVLEAPEEGSTVGGRFDEYAPQLIGNTNVHFINNYSLDGNPVLCDVNKHATKVVSIIAGQSVVYNGKTYRGVVPDATVYQTPICTYSDLITGIIACLAYDVSIVNLSFGIIDPEETAYYSVYDRAIDTIVRITNLVVVVSAGNNGAVEEEDSRIITSPARSLSAITVGNAMTKDGNSTVLSAPYSIYATSSYREEYYCVNKPDLVAPGCFDSLWKNENNYQTELDQSVGTSFSAPIVTGIAAQIIENNPLLDHQPMAVKASLLVGADLSQVNISNDTLKTDFLYDKNGAGMVNAINSVNNVIIEYSGQTSDSMNTGSYLPLFAGDRIRAVLTFSKNNDSTISSQSDLDDYDLILVKQDTINGNSALSCTYDLKNNNQIIDVTIPEDGLYYFNIYRRSIKDTSNLPTICVAYKYYYHG